MAALSSKAVRKSNQPLALVQDAFVSEAQGIVWDLRRLDEGIVGPVDFTTPIESQWVHSKWLELFEFGMKPVWTLVS